LNQAIIPVPIQTDTVRKWTHYGNLRKPPKYGHSRSFLRARDLRAHWPKPIQDQRDDGDPSQAERVKRQERMVDSSQARLSHHDGGEPHALHEIQQIDGSRNRHMQAADSFHRHKIMPPAEEMEGRENGRHPDRLSLRSGGRQRGCWKPKDIGTDCRHRIMAPSRSL
jgi:hypothetical protein